MSKFRFLVSLAPALGLAASVVSAQSDVMVNQIKQGMRWDLAYKLKPGDVSKYQMDSISSQKVTSFAVGEAGTESVEETSTTSRIYFSERVVEVDEQGVITLEFTYDNVVVKQTTGGQEQVIDTSGMTGRKFTAQISGKGKIINVEGSGDTEDFKKTLESLFLTFPDKTLKITDEWEDKRESQSADPTSGLQITQRNALKYKISDFQEYQRRDSLLMNVIETIEQELQVRQDDPGGTVTSTHGEGTGKGTSKGSIRIDAKTGQLLVLEQSSTLRNTLTVDEEQLVGATMRTKYTTDLSSTTNITLQ